MLSSKGSCLQDSAVPIICNCALGNSKYLEINYIVLPKLISPESSLFMKALVETVCCGVQLRKHCFELGT